jgi:predicted metallopeptidase
MSKEIEKGFPHTIEDVIVISDNFFELSYEQQMLILVHEKIHIFQRLFPAETNDLIMNVWKFEIKNPNLAIKVRNNPDINNITYGKENFYICQMYRNTIKDITDSDPVKVIGNNVYYLRREDLGLDLPIYINQIEHPFEIMGSYLPYIILQRLPKETKTSPDVLDWLRNFF